MPNQNPKDLDPKLKEVYERVMGTPIATPTAPTQQPASPPQPAIATPQTPMQASTPPTTSQNPQVIQTSSIPPTAVVSMPAHYDASGVSAETTKKKSFVSAPLLIIMAIVFFLVYTIFWLKFFNIPLPFISQ